MLTKIERAACGRLFCSKNEKALFGLFREGEKEVLDLPYECSYTVTTDGGVWFVPGIEGNVNTDDVPRSLKGAYTYHNHPYQPRFPGDIWGATNYSFSGSDVGFFIEQEIAYSAATDDKYEYYMRRRPDTVKCTSDEAHHRFKEISKSDAMELIVEGSIDPDYDFYHAIIEILSEELHFDYGRKKKS